MARNMPLHRSTELTVCANQFSGQCDIIGGHKYMRLSERNIFVVSATK